MGEREGPATKFLEEETLLPILIAVLAGGSFAVGLTWLTAYACTDSEITLCEVVTKNPPWLFVTTVAAVPSAILTWTWRTRQAKATLALSRSGDATSRYSAGVELLNKGGFAALGGVYALARLAKDSPDEHWLVFDTLAAFVREPLAREDEVPRKRLVQAALNAIGRRNLVYDPLGAQIDLTGADLQNANLRGLDFRQTIFMDALLSGAHFEGADMRGADFSNAQGLGQVHYDESTQLDEQWRFALQTLGAIDETPVEEPPCSDDA